MGGNTTSNVAAVLSAGLTNDVAISADGAHIYASGSDGNLRVYDALTGQLENSWHVGTDLGGIALSPDGAFLMATDLVPLLSDDSAGYNTFDVTTYKVDITTGAVTSYPVTATGFGYAFYDIAVLANGKALVTEQLYDASGLAPSWTLDLSTGTYTSNAPSVTESDYLSASADGTYVLLGENDISDARLLMYQSGSGFVATHGGYADNVSGYNYGVQAISGSAGLVAQELDNPNEIYIYDLSLHYEVHLTSQFTGDWVAGLAFDASGQNLYVLDSAHDSIIQLSTSDWSVVQTISVGAEFQQDGSAFADSLLVAPDSRYFTILSGNSVLEVGNPADQTIEGTAGDDHLTGTLFSDVINGDDGNDTLNGGAGADTLTGGNGTDILTGGAGNDTFEDTAAGLNGDTISDLHIGDKIVITDAVLDGFTASLSAGTLNFTGGSVTLGNVPEGRLVVAAAAEGGVEVRLVSIAHDDFNGDGPGDLLWRNDDGTLTDWMGQADGGFAGNHLNSNPGSSWHLVGSGDFNGDDRVDLLWQNSSGALTDWMGQADGGFVGNHLNSNPGTNWHLVGTGDFNGDGRTDLLWQNDDGTLTDWMGQADGGFAGKHLNSNPGTSWHVVGTGDFNGDGIDDILWQNDDTSLTYWMGQSDGGFIGSHLTVSTGISSWHVVGTGDFNGDGSTDILWRNDDGDVSVWHGDTGATDWMERPTGFAISAAIPGPGADWHAVSVGDFNNDNLSDILWQKSDGTLMEWTGENDGTFVSTTLTSNPGLTWHVQDPFVHDPLA